MQWSWKDSNIPILHRLKASTEFLLSGKWHYMEFSKYYGNLLTKKHAVINIMEPSHVQWNRANDVYGRTNCQKNTSEFDFRHVIANVRTIWKLYILWSKMVFDSIEMHHTTLNIYLNFYSIITTWKNFRQAISLSYCYPELLTFFLYKEAVKKIRLKKEMWVFNIICPKQTIWEKEIRCLSKTAILKDWKRRYVLYFNFVKG